MLAGNSLKLGSVCQLASPLSSRIDFQKPNSGVAGNGASGSSCG